MHAIASLTICNQPPTTCLTNWSPEVAHWLIASKNKMLKYEILELKTRHYRSKVYYRQTLSKSKRLHCPVPLMMPFCDLIL